MSAQGLEIIESSTQKTQEGIASIAQVAHLEKRDAYKSLRAVRQTMRDRLPLNDAVHFAAQLPMFLRGLFYEGWKPSIRRKTSRFSKVHVGGSRGAIAATIQMNPYSSNSACGTVGREYGRQSRSDQSRECFSSELEISSMTCSLVAPDFSRNCW